MTESLSTAFLVLFIGMITVFVVLCLVVTTGKVLISLVNKYGPSPKSKIKKQDFAPLSTNINSPSTKEGIEKKKLAAILATVEVFTQRKGKVVGIKKVNK